MKRSRQSLRACELPGSSSLNSLRRVSFGSDVNGQIPRAATLSSLFTAVDEHQEVAFSSTLSEPRLEFERSISESLWRLLCRACGDDFASRLELANFLRTKSFLRYPPSHGQTGSVEADNFEWPSCGSCGILNLNTPTGDGRINKNRYNNNYSHPRSDSNAGGLISLPVLSAESLYLLVTEICALLSAKIESLCRFDFEQEGSSDSEMLNMNLRDAEFDPLPYRRSVELLELYSTLWLSPESRYPPIELYFQPPVSTPVSSPGRRSGRDLSVSFEFDSDQSDVPIPYTNKNQRQMVQDSAPQVLYSLHPLYRDVFFRWGVANAVSFDPDIIIRDCLIQIEETERLLATTKIQSRVGTSGRAPRIDTAALEETRRQLGLELCRLFLFGYWKYGFRILNRCYANGDEASELFENMASEIFPEYLFDYSDPSGDSHPFRQRQLMDNLRSRLRESLESSELTVSDSHVLKPFFEILFLTPAATSPGESNASDEDIRKCTKNIYDACFYETYPCSWADAFIAFIYWQPYCSVSVPDSEVLRRQKPKKEQNVDPEDEEEAFDFSCPANLMCSIFQSWWFNNKFDDIGLPPGDVATSLILGNDADQLLVLIKKHPECFSPSLGPILAFLIYFDFQSFPASDLVTVCFNFSHYILLSILETAKTTTVSNSNSNSVLIIDSFFFEPESQFLNSSNSQDVKKSISDKLTLSSKGRTMKTSFLENIIRPYLLISSIYGSHYPMEEPLGIPNFFLDIFSQDFANENINNINNNNININNNFELTNSSMVADPLSFDFFSKYLNALSRSLPNSLELLYETLASTFRYLTTGPDSMSSGAKRLQSIFFVGFQLVSVSCKMMTLMSTSSPDRSSANESIPNWVSHGLTCLSNWVVANQSRLLPEDVTDAFNYIDGPTFIQILPSHALPVRPILLISLGIMGSRKIIQNGKSENISRAMISTSSKLSTSISSFAFHWWWFLASVVESTSASREDRDRCSELWSHMAKVLKDEKTLEIDSSGMRRFLDFASSRLQRELRHMSKNPSVCSSLQNLESAFESVNQIGSEDSNGSFDKKLKLARQLAACVRLASAKTKTGDLLDATGGDEETIGKQSLWCDSNALSMKWMTGDTANYILC